MGFFCGLSLGLFWFLLLFCFKFMGFLHIYSFLLFFICWSFFFYVIILTVIFLTHGNSVWSFPFGNLLKVVRFQTEEWHVLCTGHIRVLQTSLHRTVKSEIEILGVILRILSISLLTEDREQLMLILSVAPFLLGFLSRKLKWDC